MTKTLKQEQSNVVTTKTHRFLCKLWTIDRSLGCAGSTETKEIKMYKLIEYAYPGWLGLERFLEEDGFLADLVGDLITAHLGVSLEMAERDPRIDLIRLASAWMW